MFMLGVVSTNKMWKWHLMVDGIIWVHAKEDQIYSNSIVRFQVL